MNKTEIANKLLDTYKETLSIINLLISGESDIKVQADTVENSEPEEAPVSSERLITFRQIEKMFDYNINKRSNIFNADLGGPWTYAFDHNGTLAVPESQICKYMIEQGIEAHAPLDVDRQYCVSSMTITNNLGLKLVEGELSPLNKPLSTLANRAKIPAVKFGANSRRGSWRYPVEYINEKLINAKRVSGWNGDPRQTAKHFLKEMGYVPRGGNL